MGDIMIDPVLAPMIGISRFERDVAREQNTAMRAELVSALSECDALRIQKHDLNEKLMVERAETDRLRGLVAAMVARFLPLDDEPKKLKHNPFRTFHDDPRRIGG